MGGGASGWTTPTKPPISSLTQRHRYQSDHRLWPRDYHKLTNANNRINREHRNWVQIESVKVTAMWLDSQYMFTMTVQEIPVYHDCSMDTNRLVPLATWWYQHLGSDLQPTETTSICWRQFRQPYFGPTWISFTLFKLSQSSMVESMSTYC